MSDFEISPEHQREMKEIELDVARQQMYEDYPFRNFFHCVAGSEIVIDLLSQEICPGTSTEQNQRIIGELVEPRQSIIRIHNTSNQPTLIGREIGLASLAVLQTPVRVPVMTTLKVVVMPGRGMAYYYPEDITAESKYGIPEKYNYIAATYARVSVNNVDLFNTIR